MTIRNGELGIGAAWLLLACLARRWTVAAAAATAAARWQVLGGRASLVGRLHALFPPAFHSSNPGSTKHHFALRSARLPPSHPKRTPGRSCVEVFLQGGNVAPLEVREAAGEAAESTRPLE